MDTNLPAEARRWVFPQVCNGLSEVGRDVAQPRHFIKLCGTAEELMAALPSAWQLRSTSYFMTATDRRSEARRLPEGYKLRTVRNGATTVARIFAPDGRQAASGYAAEAMNVFIYDRIETAPAYRRKGLGNLIMTALRSHRRSTGAPELLVATEDGHGLYTSLGWRVLSPYSTVVIPDCTSVIYFDAALPGVRHRKPIIDIARRHRVRIEAVWIHVPLSLALDRNARRPSDQIVLEESIRAVASRFEPPSIEEGFETVIEIDARYPRATGSRHPDLRSSA